MPVFKANQHAASAEEYAARGLIVLAAEEHDKASEALLAAIDRSHDESVRHFYFSASLPLLSTFDPGQENTEAALQQTLQGAR